MRLVADGVLYEPAKKYSQLTVILLSTQALLLVLLTANTCRSRRDEISSSRRTCVVDVILHQV